MQHLKIYLDVPREDEQKPFFEIKAISIQDAIDQSVQHFGLIGLFILTDLTGSPLNQSTFNTSKEAILKVSPAFEARQSIIRIQKASNEQEKEKVIAEVVQNLQKQTYAREFFKTSHFPPPLDRFSLKIIKASIKYKEAIKLMLNDKFIQNLYYILCNDDNLDLRISSAEILTVLCAAGGDIFIVYAAKVYAEKREEYKYRSLLPIIGDTRLGAVIVGLLLTILKCAPEGRRSKIVMDFKYVGISDAVKKLKSYKLLLSNFEKALKDDSQIINFDQKCKREWGRVAEIRGENVQLENRIKLLESDKVRALKSKEELNILYNQKKEELGKVEQEIKVLKEHTEVRNNISVVIRRLNRVELIEEITKTKRDIELLTKEKEKLLCEVEGESAVQEQEQKKILTSSFVGQADKRINSPRVNFTTMKLGCRGRTNSQAPKVAVGCVVFNQPEIKVSTPLPELKWNRIILKPDHPKCLWDLLPEKKVIVSDVERTFKAEEQFATNPVISRHKYVDLCVLRNKFPSSVSLAIDINNFYYRQISERDGKFLLETLKGIHLNELDLNDGGKGIEGWLRPLLEIPAFQIKLKMWVESMFLENEIYRITPLIQGCSRAIEMVKTSRSFKELISIILATGNYLNADYPSIRAVDGFRIDLLIKLKETRLPQKQTSILDFVIKIHSNPEQLLEDLSCADSAKINLGVLIKNVKELVIKCSGLKQIIQTQIISLPGMEQANISNEVNAMMDKVIALRDFVIKTSKDFYQMMYWIIGIPSIAVEYDPITFFGILDEFKTQVAECLEDKTLIKPSVALLNKTLSELMKREKQLKFGSEDDLLAKVVDCMKKGKIKASILRKVLN